MTAICSGGTSGPKAGVAESIIFSAGALASLLNNKGGVWASIAAPLLGVVSYSATELCTVDPPATTPISAEEYAALLALSPWDLLQSAIAKLADHVKAAIWYDLCECKTVGTPAQPSTVLAPPPDLYIPPTTGAPCDVRTYRATASIRSSGSASVLSDAWFNVPLHPELPTSAFASASGFWTGHNGSAWPSPSWTYWKMRASLVSAGNNSDGIWSAYASNQLDPATFNDQLTLNLTAAAPQKASGIAPTKIGTTNANRWHIGFWQIGGTVRAVADITLEVWCAGSSPEVGAPCQADPAVLALLGQIMQTVTLIQRQAVPFGYVFGDTHSGLTGNGSVDLQGVIGAVLTVTESPTMVGSEDGTPDVVFDAGWFNWGTADGALPREFIRCSPQLSIPRSAGLLTRFNHSLPPGVEVELREVLREP